MKKLLIVMMMLFCVVGCDQANKYIDQVKGYFEDGITPEKALEILSVSEDFHAKAKVSVATYFVENPGKISGEQIAKIKAANEAFEVAYKTTKKVIADIKYAKQGGKLELSDIENELLIFAGKYGEFKKAMDILKGRITFPDETTTTNTVTPESVVNQTDLK